MKRAWILLLLMSLGLNLGLALKIFMVDRGDVNSFEPPGGPRGMPERPYSATDSTVWTELARRRFDRIARDLQLTPEQGASFRKIQAEAAPDLREQRRQLHQARRRLHALCLADALRPARIREGVKELAVAQGRLDSVVMETMLRELADLTPAQKERYLRMMPWDKSGHPGAGQRGQRRGPGHGGRPPD